LDLTPISAWLASVPIVPILLNDHCTCTIVVGQYDASLFYFSDFSDVIIMGHNFFFTVFSTAAQGPKNCGALRRPDPLILAIPPWVGAMSTGDGSAIPLEKKRQVPRCSGVSE